jgi:hypothetical protein
LDTEYNNIILLGENVPNQPTALEIISVISSLATPILLLLLSGIGWFIGNRIERRTNQDKLRYEEERERQKYWRDLEQKLREDRISVYNAMLEPFIIIFTKDEAFANDKLYKNRSKTEVSNGMILSLDYKRNGFKLALMGSDNVVRAFNELMQYIYAQPKITDETKAEHTLKLMNILGTLLLEIRRSVGNETTKLDNLEMLEWMINDIRQLRTTPL